MLIENLIQSRDAALKAFDYALASDLTRLIDALMKGTV